MRAVIVDICRASPVGQESTDDGGKYQGTVDIAGNVSLSGSVDLPGDDQAHIDTQFWTARTDTNPDRLNGSYTDIARILNIFGQQVIDFVDEFKDLVRQP